MIGQLPQSLQVAGKELEINSDYRVVLRIFDAFADPDGETEEKMMFLLEMLYSRPEEIEDYEEAIEKALWFVNCGNKRESREQKPVYDWEQDESMIFSAVNKVAGIETRNVPYMHYWTWMGYFNEVGESLFTTVVGIREKLNSNKKLEKHEREFYRKNRDIVKIERKYSQDEKDELELLNEIV